MSAPVRAMVKTEIADYNERGGIELKPVDCDWPVGSEVRVSYVNFMGRVTGLEALRDMAENPGKVYSWGGSEFRFDGARWEWQRLAKTRNRPSVWEQAPLTRLMVMSDGWQEHIETPQPPGGTE